jgi:hypothetical protein
MTDDKVIERTSVARIFRSLELLAEAPRTPSGLAHELNIDRSTALRLAPAAPGDGLRRP